jgi:plasmid stabilization system protein ParE
MSFPVVWSPKAQDKYLEILAYWHDTSLDFALILDDEVEKLLHNLSQFKNLCPPSTRQPIFRKCVILRKYSLIYRNYEEVIWIVDIVDNRRRPRY